MKRPLAAVGFTYLLVLLAANFLSINLNAVASLLLLAAAPLVFFLGAPARRKRVAVLLLTASLALMAHSLTLVGKVYPVEALAGMESVMRATVRERTLTASGRPAHTVEVDDIDLEGAPTGFRMNLYAIENERYDYGDRLALRVRFAEVPDASRLQDRAEGIYLYGMVEEVFEVLPAERLTLQERLYTLRDGLMREIRRLLPGYQGELLGSIALGDDTGIEPEVLLDFQVSGLAHILAVSGLHITAFATLVFRGLTALQFGRYGVGRRMAAGWSLAAIVLYIMLTGCAPSAIRAGVMTGLGYLGILLYRDADPINSMGLAALALTFANPFAAADVGLLLSFAATLGILAAAEPIAGWMEGALRLQSRPARAVVGAAAVTLAANLSTLPITMLAFGRVPLLAPLANLLVSPLMPLLLPVSILTALLAALPPLHFLAAGCGFAAGLLLSVLRQIAGMMAALPFAQLGASARYLGIWVLGASGLMLLAMGMGGAKRVRTASLLCVVTLLMGLLSHQVFTRQVLSVAVIDEDAGSHAVLALDGHTMVWGGGRKPFFGTLASRTVEGMGGGDADLILLPMLDRAHGAGAVRLAESIEADWMILPDAVQNEAVLAAAGGIDQAVPVGDMALDCWGGRLEIRLLEAGAAVRLETGDASVLMLMGEVDLAALPPAFCRCGLVILEEAIPVHLELLRADRAVICRDELRATLTMRLTALGTEVLNPQDGGTGLTVQIRLRGGASAVM